MAKRTKIGRAANRTRGISISDPKFLDTPPPSLGGAWSGSIARLRIYHSTGMVFAYRLRVPTRTRLVSRTTTARASPRCYICHSTVVEYAKAVLKRCWRGGHRCLVRQIPQNCA